MRLEVIQGDITLQHVDAIVNAANEHLAHGGGVALAIARAAGPELQKESKEIAPVPTGQAKATKGYNLPAKWVIHAVGPRWSGGESNEAQLLASAYTEALKVAGALGVKTIAFPSISTAIFGFPVELAAPIAVKAISEELENQPGIEKVMICTFSNDDFLTYSSHL